MTIAVKVGQTTNIVAYFNNNLHESSDAPDSQSGWRAKQIIKPNY